MTNLPAERPESTPALLGGQAALFENPAQLLDLDDVALKELAVLFGRHGASVFAQVRAQAGLLAWAGWFRFGEVTYSAFLLGLSKDLGVQPDTLMKWRRDVVKDRKLVVPGVVKARSDAAKEGHKTAGQASGAGRSSGKAAPIRATSKEVPLEPSGGAELQAPAGPTDEAPASLRSAPLDLPVVAGDSRDDSRTLPPNEVAPLLLANVRERMDDWGDLANAQADDLREALRLAAAELNARDAAPVDVDAIGLRWLKSKTTREVRAIGDPWGPAIRAEVMRWASAFGFSSTSRGGPSLVQAGSTGPVPIPPPRYDLHTPPRSGRKGHALDCSCLGCKPAKAVAK